MTTEFSLRHVVVFAVLQCGGDNAFVDTEDVAVAANRLAPGRLTWRKYPDQINLELVRVYLSDAKKPANGTLLLGTGVKGWRLSAQGLRWVRENESAFEEAFQSKLLSARPQRTASVTNSRTQRERERLCSTHAWQKWAGNAKAEITQQDASEVFRIDSYASENLVDIKIGRLQQLFADDEQVSEFINFAHQALKVGHGNR